MKCALSWKVTMLSLAVATVMWTGTAGAEEQFQTLAGIQVEAMSHSELAAVEGKLLGGGLPLGSLFDVLNILSVLKLGGGGGLGGVLGILNLGGGGGGGGLGGVLGILNLGGGGGGGGLGGVLGILNILNLGGGFI